MTSGVEHSPETIAARERRWGRLIGPVALLSVACSFGALIASARAVRPAPGERERADRVDQLVDFEAGADTHALAASARVLGLLLVVAVALYLHSAIRSRKPDVRAAVRVLAVAGPLLVAASTVAGYFVFREIAEEFVRSGPRTPERADDLVEGSTALRVIGVSDLATHLVFGAWIGLASYYAMNVGLLTRFLAIWGIAAGAATGLTLPFGEALFVGWLGSVGLLALGYWPGGRPPAWDAGRAIPPDRALPEDKSPSHG